MYKRTIIGLFTIAVTLMMAGLCVREVSVNRELARQAFRTMYIDTSETEDRLDCDGMMSAVSSGERIVSYGILEKEEISGKYSLPEKDYEALLKIVEAEAGGEDQNGKLLVANVVLNRVENDKFPNTVWDVIMQNNDGVAQFSPTKDGRFMCVSVSDDTREAVSRALKGENISEGALYFCARKKVDDDKLRWFDNSLRRLFSYGNHDFYM